MSTLDFKAANNTLKSLSYKELKRLRHHLEELISANHTEHALANREEKISRCCHCWCSSIIRYGTTAKGHQRFKCSQCKKTFNTLTKTALSGMKLQDKWQQYSEGMWHTLKLRDAAKKFKINLKTAWKWRHKLLNKPMKNRQRLLAGIVEADETFIPESFKGNRKTMARKSRKRGGGRAEVPVFIALDRQGHVVHQVLDANTKIELKSVIQKVLAPESVFCTDGNISYKSIAQELPYSVEHKRLIRLDNETVKDGIYHIQTINNWIMRWKSWMVQFCGVGTAYLENYLAWFREIDHQKGVEQSWVDYALMTNGTNT